MERFRIMNLFDKIIEACSRKAMELEGFADRDGAVRLCYVPQSQEGKDLLGNSSAYADRYELVTRLCGGNYVLNRHDREAPPVDTYAFSALKIASCFAALEHGLAARSGEYVGSSYDEVHGFAPYRGAILYQLSMDDKVFAILAVSVSGATQDEDEETAFASENAMKNWCKKNSVRYTLL